MVKPEDDVPIIVEVGACDRDGLVGVMGEDGKRASSIKGHAPDCTRVNVVLIEDALDRCANTSPDVIRRLLLSKRSAGLDLTAKLEIGCRG